MARMFAIMFSIVFGGAAIGSKLYELAGIESYLWIIGSIALQVLASRME